LKQGGKKIKGAPFYSSARWKIAGKREREHRQGKALGPYCVRGKKGHQFLREKKKKNASLSSMEARDSEEHLAHLYRGKATNRSVHQQKKKKGPEACNGGERKSNTRSVGGQKEKVSKVEKEKTATTAEKWGSILTITHDAISRKTRPRPQRRSELPSAINMSGRGDAHLGLLHRREKAKSRADRGRGEKQTRLSTCSASRRSFRRSRRYKSAQTEK